MEEPAQLEPALEPGLEPWLEGARGGGVGLVRMCWGDTALCGRGFVSSPDSCALAKTSRAPCTIHSNLLPRATKIKRESTVFREEKRETIQS